MDLPAKSNSGEIMKSNGIKKIPRSKNSPQAKVASERRKTPSNSTTKTSTASSSQISSIDVLNSVQYLRSCITSPDSIKTDAILLFNVQSLKEIAENSYESVEKISNFLKKDETNNLTGKFKYIPYVILYDFLFDILCVSFAFLVVPFDSALLLRLQ